VFKQLAYILMNFVQIIVGIRVGHVEIFAVLMRIPINLHFPYIFQDTTHLPLCDDNVLEMPHFPEFLRWDP
jgi:hypothetical protein